MAVLSSPLLSLIVLLPILFYYYREHKLRKRLPPGPPPLPFIGNLHQAPSKYPWRTYTEWHRQYGPIFSLQYGPSTLIMLGNNAVTRDLLDKRSNIYSSRPRLMMVGECISKGFRTLLLPYGVRWRVHHRLQASFLNIQMSARYRELQDLESKQVVYEFLTRNDFAKVFHRYSASLIFSLAYGRRAVTGEEEEVKVVDHIMLALNKAFLDTWIVDIFPALNELPKFLAPWKWKADKMHQFEDKFFTGIMAEAENKKPWNWAKQAHEIKESTSLSRTELAYVLGVTYEAGSDTTTMALECFLLAAVLYPGAVCKAQEELDTVVGPERLPSFEDLDKLPYLQAFIREVHRWRHIIPGGVPHAVTEDDEYMGYYIPKGATVFGCHWAINMDPETYKEPERFDPDRWIENPNLPFSAFGFGRRVCPGQHVGQNSLLINISRILWAYNIEPTYEIIDGKKVQCEIDPLAFANSFNSNPLPFKVQLNARNPKVGEVVTREWNAVEKDLDVILGRIDASRRGSRGYS
ncbi:hypothetical protein AJ80_02379 [Polytolypa hystricis UAMH7299]|uniref:Cytochrome P450 n=1 Tax=Polytolypa hystricis (strain UAMH7299) TaxID=1447883 RepID=A0A2B7YRT7_POLH7|nr:hypothetical protein AJ80_02379 [Polytolypa hystricis UAMH7299]